MKRGIVFTIDSMFALYLALVMTALFISVLEVQAQNQTGDIYLSRIARDMYEYTYYARNDKISIAPPAGISEFRACDYSSSVGAVAVYGYNKIAAYGYNVSLDKVVGLVQDSSGQWVNCSQLATPYTNPKCNNKWTYAGVERMYAQKMEACIDGL